MARGKERETRDKASESSESPPPPPPPLVEPERPLWKTVVALILMIGGAIALGVVALDPKVQEAARKTYKSVFPPNALFTAEQIAKYDGKHEGYPAYLVILGHVFDVDASDFYKGNGGYSFFAGQDATTAFVTGVFEGDAVDDVRELPDRNMPSIEEWLEFYQEHEVYEYQGKLIGTYFDKNGEPTEVMKEYERKLAVARKDIEAANLTRQKYPYCNSRWTKEEGGKVWCTRSLLTIKEATEDLVPRLFVDQGQESERCACVMITELDQEDFKVYDNCNPFETTCVTKPPEKEEDDEEAEIKTLNEPAKTAEESKKDTQKKETKKVEPDLVKDEL